MIDKSAVRTDFGTWFKLADSDNVFARPRRFILQQRIEHRPTDIANRLCEAVVFHHALNIQGFQSKRIHAVRMRQRVGQFMQEIPPRIGDAFMQKRDALPRLVTICAADLFFRQPPLQNRQAGDHASQMTRVVNFDAIRIDRKVRQPQVNAERGVCLNTRGFRQRVCCVNQDAHEIFPCGRAAQRDRLDRACKPAMQLGSHCADFGERDGARVKIHFDALRKLTRLHGVFPRFEFRKPVLFREESLKGIIQIPQGHLQGLGIYIGQPHGLCLPFQDRQLGNEIDTRQRFLLRLIRLNFLMQCPIPDEPTAAEMLRDLGALRHGWIAAILKSL